MKFSLPSLPVLSFSTGTFRSNQSKVFVFALSLLALPAFAQFQFIAPMPGSVGHNPNRCIILREGHELAASTIQKKYLFSIEGSKSGNHDFSIGLSNDHRTIILQPLMPFDYSEKITVELKKGLLRKDGIAVAPLNFSFSTHRKFNSAQLQAFEQLHERAEDEENSDLKTSTDSLPKADIAVWKNTNPNPGDVFYDFGFPHKTGTAIINSNGDSIYITHEKGFYTDFELNHNGYLTYINNPDSEVDMLDSSYVYMRRFQPVNGYKMDAHDFQIFPDGHYYVIADEDSIVNMQVFNSSYSDSAEVLGTVIQEFDGGDHLVFEWRSFDHVGILEAPHEDLSAQLIDPIHTNSIAEDTDGNIVVSHRHIDQITKIDTKTGAFIWRLGGDSNQFVFINDSEQFNYQHDARVLPNGHVTVFDNGNWHPIPVSAAKEYQLDLVNKTATLVWSYQHPLINGTVLWSSARGSVQRFANGGTFIAWGNVPVMDSNPSFTEIDSAKSIVWEARIYPGTGYLSYRAHRFLWTPCARPADSFLIATAIAGDTITLSWSHATNAGSYEIQYQLSGSATWDSVMVNDTGDDVYLTGLKPASTYEWHVKSLCSAPNPPASNFSAVKTFTTPFGLTTPGVNDQEWQVYPNPANSFCDIQLPANFQPPLEISIEDELGKTCLNENVSSANTIEIPLQTISSGVYMVKIVSGNQSFVKELVVEKK